MSYFVKKNVYANWNEFCSRIKKIRFTLWISINIHEWNFTLNLLFSIKAVRARKANSLARPNSRRSIPSEGKEISKLVGARRHRLLSSPPTMTIAGRERGSRHIRRPISKKAKCKVEQKEGGNDYVSITGRRYTNSKRLSSVSSWSKGDEINETTSTVSRLFIIARCK